MSQVRLAAQGSREIGSRPVRRLRATGRIPAVIYGVGVEPQALDVDAKEFRAAVSGDQGLNTLIELEIGTQSFVVMAREIQRHPVKGTVNHVDFQVVDPNQEVVAVVPVHLVGDAVEVRHADFEVDQQLFSIHVSGKPASLPHHVDVDVSAMRVGSTIRVSDVPLPEGVTAAGDPDATIVATHAGRAAKTVVAAAPA
jgi:large subunit ribosomal protein L25